MNDNTLILAHDNEGKPLTVDNIKQLLKLGKKKELANFIYNRLYERYLKPFEYESDKYKKEYKNGFSLMATCCLLIETYVSFKERKYKKTYTKSRECFLYFFTSEKRFSDFSAGGVLPDGKLAGPKDGGIPNDFYYNVRCGILHNAETINGWKITRKKEIPVLQEANKQINATKFANRLKAVLTNYKNSLIQSDFERDQIWLNFRNRLELLFEQI